MEDQPTQPESADLGRIAEQVRQRAAELQRTDDTVAPLDPRFVRQCLDANERGDGVMFAQMHRDRFLFNVTPKDGQWYTWSGHVWETDETRRALDAVEHCALQYQMIADSLADEIREKSIVKGHAEAYKIKVKAAYASRAKDLRGLNRASKALTWAPVVDESMACRDEDFDRKPWLLPCANGIINLKTGALIQGRPEDRLSRTINVAYDPHADYQEWIETVEDICGDPEVAAFIKRSLGYAITGFSHEQYYWIFVGPGRNGKGTIFDLVGDIMGPYYHEISRAMLIEQRSEPSPSASSEHKYSLLGKRIIVGSETNKGQKIDGAAIKSLTGEDRINCRPLYKSEVVFKPTHTLFLHTNHVPYGVTKDFALLQRLLQVEFPHMYVDNPEAEEKKAPMFKGRFRKKDPLLKDRLRLIKPGILRWLVEGCLEWQQIGLAPPQSILDAVKKLAVEEDYVGQFMADCITAWPDHPDARMSCTRMYEAFRWWWAMNMDGREQRIPSMKGINSAFRDRGVLMEKSGGKTWIYGHTVSLAVEDEVDEWLKKGGKA